VPVPHDQQTVIARRLHKDEVFDRVLTAIMTGELGAGERLRDVELEAWLGVSRTPIRLALGRLESIGLVEAVPQRFTRVARPRPSLVPDLTVALCALWCDLAVEALAVLTEGQRRELRRLLAEARAAVEDFEAAPSPGPDDSRAVVVAAFAGVDLVTSACRPTATRLLVHDVGTRLRDQASMLGPRLDVGPLGAVLAGLDGAVADRDPRALRAVVDSFAARSATSRPARSSERAPWWRR